MRKLIFSLLVISGLFLAQISPAKVAAADNVIDISQLGNGVIGIQYDSPSNKKLKLMIEAEGKRYTYNLNANGKQEFFPLQLGNVQYSVSVMENTTDNKYRVVKQETVKLALNNNNVVFLNSTQNVSWDDSMSAIQKAKSLTSGAKTDIEKVNAIYQYIINNTQYDYELAKNLTPGYLPDIDKVMKSHKGICYDYSSLFASMLRSVGVPAKLVMGKTTYVNVYHAWNEVYLNDKWVTIDTTVDSGLKLSNKKFDMVKKVSDYEADSVY
jgi:hypothetical protein